MEETSNNNGDGAQSSLKESQNQIDGIILVEKQNQETKENNNDNFESSALIEQETGVQIDTKYCDSSAQSNNYDSNYNAHFTESANLIESDDQKGPNYLFTGQTEINNSDQSESIGSGAVCENIICEGSENQLQLDYNQNQENEKHLDDQNLESEFQQNHCQETNEVAQNMSVTENLQNGHVENGIPNGETNGVNEDHLANEHISQVDTPVEVTKATMSATGEVKPEEKPISGDNVGSPKNETVADKNESEANRPATPSSKRGSVSSTSSNRASITQVEENHVAPSESNRPATPSSKRGSVTSTSSNRVSVQVEENHAVPSEPNRPATPSSKRGSVTSTSSNRVSVQVEENHVAPSEPNRPATPSSKRGSVTSTSSNRASVTQVEENHITPNEDVSQKPEEPSSTEEKRETFGSDEGEPISQADHVTNEKTPSRSSSANNEPKPETGKEVPQTNGVADNTDETDTAESSTSGQIDIRENRGESSKSADKADSSEPNGVADPNEEVVNRPSSALAPDLSVISETDEKTSHSYEKCDKETVPTNINEKGVENLAVPDDAALPSSEVKRSEQVVTLTVDQEDPGNDERNTSQGRSPEHKDQDPYNNPASDKFQESMRNEARNQRRWWHANKKHKTGGGDAGTVDPSCCSIV